MKTMYTESVSSLTDRYEKIESEIVSMLARRLPSHLKYHNLSHTIDVRRCAEKIALKEEISPWDRDFWIIKTAAVLHDIGYLFNEKMHEQAGANFAETFLANYDFSLDDISSIKGIILATKIPQTPETILEEIVCDADVANFGRDDFFEKGRLLVEELGLMENKKWYEGTLKLLESHNYHTGTANIMFNNKKSENIKRLKEIIASL